MNCNEDMVQHLLELTTQFKLIERSMQSFEGWFIDASGTIDGWSLEDIRREFRSHALIFARAGLQYQYIDTRLDLYALNGGYVGYYSLITTLNGEAEDDYLVFDLSKEEYMKRHQAESSFT